jgi:asparagine synthase (glutamine-hydrolysing)
MKNPILIDEKYNWGFRQFETYTVHHRGRTKSVDDILSAPDNSKGDISSLKAALSAAKGTFAFIAESADWIMAATDTIRSYPVFYFAHNKDFCISNSARQLKDTMNLHELDPLSLLEFRMAGYVTGRETLFKHLCQLQAGEFLIWYKQTGILHVERYYLYYSQHTEDDIIEHLTEKLEDVTNHVFRRIIEEANGAPILVPLSGGLDSRLIICKLKQLGYDNFAAFSYGPKGNYEAKAARLAAEKAKVPWFFVPGSMKESREFFGSALRRSYWDYADGLSIIPNMQDLHALAKLIKNKKLSPDTIIINGQSGDFITGGHVPAALSQPGAGIPAMLQWALDKHFSLWRELRTPENEAAIKDKILKTLSPLLSDPLDVQGLSRVYEMWEWQERQCKYVVAGQRIYDFLGLHWSLPLWDKDLLDYWAPISLGLKYKQNLYRYYLNRFDFFGCFKGFDFRIWRWPGITIAAVPIARAIKGCFGPKASERFYASMRCFGHYREAYAPYSLARCMALAPEIRGALSLNIETWLTENHLGDHDDKKEMESHQ